MEEQPLSRLMRSVLDVIVRANQSELTEAHARGMSRVIALLWSAHDELELIGRPVLTGARRK
jgi:hypothetical protein